MIVFMYWTIYIRCAGRRKRSVKHGANALLNMAFPRWILLDSYLLLWFRPMFMHCQFTQGCILFADRLLELRYAEMQKSAVPE